MSKNKGNFANRAAKKFSDISKVDVIPQSEIFGIFRSELKIMLDQVTAAREHRQNAGLCENP